MGKLGLQGADLLPASLLCSQGNEQWVGVNHQAALPTTVTASASRSRQLRLGEARSPAPTGTGGGSAPSPTAICIGKLCHLPPHKQKWWNSGERGGSFRNKHWFLNCTLLLLLHFRPLQPASRPSPASKGDTWFQKGHDSYLVLPSPSPALTSHWYF